MNDPELRAAIEPAIKPLMAALAWSGAADQTHVRGFARLVAAPDGQVVLDTAAGSRTIALADWQGEAHAPAREHAYAALAALGVPVSLDGPGSEGMRVQWVGGCLVLERPPSAHFPLDGLVAAGVISRLAADLLVATLRLGRNVLCVGPWAACADLMAALMATSSRPALLTGDAGAGAGAGALACLPAAPPEWPCVATQEDARALGATCLATWGSAPAAVVSAMQSGCGVIGWLDAPGSSRALIRLELQAAAAASAATPAAPGPSSPLHVLAAVDVIACVGRGERSVVSDIEQVTLVDLGYRLETLFTRGVPPVPHALVPLAVPDFLGELAGIGLGVLADDLNHAVPATLTPAGIATGGERRGSVSASSASPEAASVSASGPAASASWRDPQRRHEAGGAAAARIRAQPPEPPAPTSSAPGWELDLLGDDAVTATAATDEISSADSAALAAAYGLAPPPLPAAVAKAQLGASSRRPGFAAALQRAKARDRRSEEGATPAVLPGPAAAPAPADAAAAAAAADDLDDPKP